METKKPWYMSESIWASIVTLACAVVSALAIFNVISSDLAVKITGVILTISGSVGIHGRVNADTKIG